MEPTRGGIGERAAAAIVVLAIMIGSIAIATMTILNHPGSSLSLQSSVRTISKTSTAFDVSGSSRIPTSFTLNGYNFKVFNNGPPQLPPWMTNVKTQIIVEVSKGQDYQNVSFLWLGSWPTYYLPEPLQATALNGAVSLAWGKNGDGSAFVLSIATS